MSSLSRDDVAHLAMLARIELTDAELDRMLGELSVILDAVALVQQAPTEGVEPMSHPLPLVNVTRPDEVRPGLTSAQALSGLPRPISSASPSPGSSPTTDPPPLVCRLAAQARGIPAASRPAPQRKAPP